MKNLVEEQGAPTRGGALALARVPGLDRTLTLLGLVPVALALLVSALPWFYGLGLGWSLVLWAGGILVTANEVLGFTRLDPARPMLALPRFPWLSAGYALLVGAVAFQQVGLAILVPGLWLLAAGVLLAGQAQRRSALGLGLRRLGQGSRRWLLAGVWLCLLALFLPWGTIPGSSFLGWSGGLEVVPDWDGGTTLQYNPAMNPYLTYFPGWTVSGRAHQGAVWLVLALAGLLGWAARSVRDPLNARGWWVGPLLALGAGLWWVTHLRWEPGVLLFLPGLVLIAIGFVRLWRAKG